ncbi:hypothetical protein KSF_085440 [Reticulibacter mediterranei]|uniref:Baseplate protein J-like barrel domain-containing protein n=1 Tax=Reticulibacter mediterranei TaxID=2778369 RepID=A0A8J3J0A3_9CHLR|nr:hypothetical protein KSF_085440 [Reticulibacter mediterranei]
MPAILLPVRTVTGSVPVKATGVKQYPAITASGTLTITNGGMLVQYLPAGFLLASNSGVEGATDESVTVPAGNGESYGTVTVSAYAMAAGRNGNIPAYSINRIYGTDIFVKNTRVFSGGRDASSITSAADSDKQTALMSARSQTTSQQPFGLHLKPWSEVTEVSDKQARAIPTCQPITDHIPTRAHVLSIRVRETRVVLTCRGLAGACERTEEGRPTSRRPSFLRTLPSG